MFKFYNDALYQAYYREAANLRADTNDSEYSKSSDAQHQKDRNNLDPSDDPSGDDSSGPKSSDLTDINQDANPTPASYDFTEEELQVETKDMGVMVKTYFYIRLFLWNRIDHIQFIRIKYKKEHDQFRLVIPKLQDYGVFILIQAYILTHSYSLLIIATTLNFLWNSDVISLTIVLSLLLYSILENPLPSMKFYKYLMGYVLVIISIKFVY